MRHPRSHGLLPFASTRLIVLLSCVAIAIASRGQILMVLHSFNNTDGANPEAGLVQATDGNLWGTTFSGGANGEGGTVFKIAPGGTLTTLYSFCSRGCKDGADPSAAPVQAADGNFYGTTVNGGTNGEGTVFKITPSGMLTTLYNFCSQSGCTDGENPLGGLVQGTDGNFYGTTNVGPTKAVGTVFKITPTGTLTTLYGFCSQSGCTDGENPFGRLVQATDGNFYGTTFTGGAHGHGTVFKINPSGTLSRLYSFCSQSSCTDGSSPMAGLVQATDGNFYGTTEFGGADNQGTVFKITSRGTLATLYSFCSRSGCSDGANPLAGLVQATDGNFYGTTFAGGAHNFGTLFKITPGGTLTTLYSFCSQSGCTDGDNPQAGLVQATDGSFYGTTTHGGATGNFGTVFTLSVGLSPFVETRPTTGKVGAAVIVLGNNLTRTTRVTFNGTVATFTVVSSFEIKTTVPKGATTGKVKVTTPGRTLTSNVNFRVAPTISSFSPTSGPIGTSVVITGESFTGATSVTFGGVNAISFKVDSYTQITATVPSGAKTGKIGVTTPGGTATSAGTFTIT